MDLINYLLNPKMHAKIKTIFLEFLVFLKNAKLCRGYFYYLCKYCFLDIWPYAIKKLKKNPK
jgi:hypothetical protein